MKISGPTPNYIQQTYSNQNSQQPAAAPQGNTGSTGEEVRGDSINLSEKTRDLQKVSQNLENQPAEREQRVAELKEQVEAGQYTVNAERVAEKMVGSIMDELG